MADPTPLQEFYGTCYLAGRDARLLKIDVDVDKIADTYLSKLPGSTTVYELLMAAVDVEAKKATSDRVKRAWVSEYAEDIVAAGADKETAWQCYERGRADEALSRIEPDFVEALQVAIGDEDENDDDDDSENDGE